jgi:hypothetical protein
LVTLTRSSLFTEFAESDCFLFLAEFVNETGLPAGLPCIFFASDILFTLRSTEHMRERLVTSKVSCIRRKRGQIKGLQDNIPFFHTSYFPYDVRNSIRPSMSNGKDNEFRLLIICRYLNFVSLVKIRG